MKETILDLQARSIRDNLFFTGIPEQTTDNPEKSRYWHYPLALLTPATFYSPLSISYTHIQYSQSHLSISTFPSPTLSIPLMTKVLCINIPNKTLYTYIIASMSHCTVCALISAAVSSWLCFCNVFCCMRFSLSSSFWSTGPAVPCWHTHTYTHRHTNTSTYIC